MVILIVKDGSSGRTGGEEVRDNSLSSGRDVEMKSSEEKAEVSTSIQKDQSSGVAS